MKRKMLVAVMLLLFLATCVTAAKMEDFSKTLPHAKKYPKALPHIPGMQKMLAPDHSLEYVDFYTSGRHAGSNSKPIWVWAVPKNCGAWWKIVRIYGYCGNPAGGGWPGDKPKVSIKEEQKKVVTFTVEAPIPPVEAPVMCSAPCVPLTMEKSEARELNMPYRVETDRMEARLAIAFVPPLEIQQVGQQPCPPPDNTCPGIDPPTDPPVSATTGTGNPSGGIPLPPTTDPHQPPPANPGGHGTGGATWDPSPSAPTVADPVSGVPAGGIPLP